jgi:tRNA 2-selenouridine synthase
MGEPMIDLEGIAHHKGSAFGAINEPPQPSQEMFENKLANQLYFTFGPALFDGNAEEAENNNPAVWLEDESQRIGSVNIPQQLWNTMRTAPVYFLDIPFEQRLDHLVEGYGNLDKEQMLNAIVRIKKRLGGLETKTAVNFLIEDNIRESFRVLLTYYDKQYLKGLSNRQNYEQLVTKLSGSKVDASLNARKLHHLTQAIRQTISS